MKLFTILSLEFLLLPPPAILLYLSLFGPLVFWSSGPLELPSPVGYGNNSLRYCPISFENGFVLIKSHV